MQECDEHRLYSNFDLIDAAAGIPLGVFAGRGLPVMTLALSKPGTSSVSGGGEDCRLFGDFGYIHLVLQLCLLAN